MMEVGLKTGFSEYLNVTEVCVGLEGFFLMSRLGPHASNS
jgi:hypothetical protein